MITQDVQLSVQPVKEEHWYSRGLRSYSHLFGGFVVSGVLTFLSIAVLSRWLKPAGYGQLALFLAVGQSMTYFITFWASSSLLRFGAEECHTTGSLRSIFWARALILIPWCLVISVGLWVAQPFWRALSNLPHLNPFWTIGFVLALTSTQSIQLSYQAADQTVRAAIWQAAERLAWLVGTAVLIWLGTAPSADAVIPVIVTGTASTAVVSLLLFDRRYWWPPMTISEDVRRFLSFSWPLIIGQLGGYLTTQWVALAFLRHWHTLQDVGVFQVAYQLMGALQQVVMLTLPVTLPMLVRLKQDGNLAGIRQYVTQVIPGLLSVFALGLMAIGFAGAWLIPHAFGHAYASVVEIFTILLIGLGSTALFMGLMPVFQLRDDNRSIMSGMLVGGLVTLLGDLWFIPSGGVIGAACASSAGFVVATGVLIWRLSRMEKWSWISCLPALVGLVLMWGVFSKTAALRLLAVPLLVVCIGWMVRHIQMLRRQLAVQTFSTRTAQPSSLAVGALVSVSSPAESS